MAQRATRAGRAARSRNYSSVVEHLVAQIKESYADLPDVLNYLDQVMQVMVDNVDDFRKQEESSTVGGMTVVTHQNFHQYKVNVLVGNSDHPGAPIISEDSPTYSNLVGTGRTPRTVRRTGHGLHPDQGGRAAPCERRLPAAGYPQGAGAAVCLGRIEMPRGRTLRDPHRIAGADVQHGQHCVAGTRSRFRWTPRSSCLATACSITCCRNTTPNSASCSRWRQISRNCIERNADTQMLHAQLISTQARKEDLLPFDRGAVAQGNRAQRAPGGGFGTAVHPYAQHRGYFARGGLLPRARRGTPWWRRAMCSAPSMRRSGGRTGWRSRLQEAIPCDTLVIATQGAVTGPDQRTLCAFAGRFRIWFRRPALRRPPAWAMAR